MSGDELTTIILTALVSGAITAIGSSILTIAGLRVQIKYLEQADERHEKGITRAHQRIDEIQNNGCNHVNGHRT